MTAISATTYMSLNTYLGSNPGERFYAEYTGLTLLGFQDFAVGAGSTLQIQIPYSASGFGNIPVIVKNKDNGGPIILSWKYNGQSAVSNGTMQILENQFGVIPNVGVASAISANAYGASAVLHVGLLSG